jgi:4-amino-4-deoxy-L-arabinose transferase-like glycosyltransferase
MSQTTLSPADRRELRLPVDPPRDPIGSLRSSRTRLLAWAWRHRISLAIVLPLLVVTAALRIWGIDHGPALADDEGTYVAQAWAVQAKHTLAPYTYWYDHPPLGWLQIAAFTWITGAFSGTGLDVVAVRHLMVGYAVVDAALIFLLCRRLGTGRLTAGAAVALWALSPLAVGYSRMVYLDNIALPWVLGAFVLAATVRRSLWAQTAAGALFAVGVLTKETMIVLLPGLVWVVVQHTTRRTRSFCLVGFASLGALILVLYPLMAVLRGELLPGPGHVSLLQSLKWQFLSRPSTGSALSAHSGSRTLLDSWLSMDGWLLGLGLIGALVCLRSRPLRPVAATLLLLTVVGLRPGYLPQPYVIALLPLAAICAAASVGVIWAALRDRPPVPVRPNARREARLRAAGRLAAVAGIVAIAAALVPAWISGNRALAAENQSAPVADAEHWLEAHAQTAATRLSGQWGSDVLVDDTMWSDLVTHGFPQQQVVWFYKLDYVDNLDPSVRRRIHDYRDFGWVVDSPIIRSGLADSSPTTYALARQAIAHSRVVARFGTGTQQIDIRRVDTRPASQETR